ncbi:TPA: hypothetical protein ACF02O_004109 [Yersinia enterocolitica]
MAKIIKHFLTNITPSDKKSVWVFESRDKPIVTNDFIHLKLISDRGITDKGFSLSGIAEYSITAVEE